MSQPDAGQRPLSFNDAVNAVCNHLEDLRSRGVRHVPVSQSTLEALSRTKNPAAELKRTAPALRSLPETTPAGAPATLTSYPLPPVKRPAAALPPVLERSNEPLPPPLEGEARVKAMNELRARAESCVRCPALVAARKRVVFGVGDIFSPVMFVGEAPGADEDAAGEPFVGRAGQLLTKIIETMGFSRQTVFIANILKCRPDTPGQASGNRKPRPDEMATCFPYLMEQIELIQPRVMVALGATAVEGLLGNPTGITKLRGHWQSFRGIPVMPTYHPAYLLRNMSLAERRKVWEDMLKVLEKLGRTISERQRGFFLKSGE